MINRTWSRRDLLRRGTVAGGLVVAPGFLVACQRTQPGSGEPTQSTLQKIQDAGVVNVGFANEGPYAFQNEQGELVGQAPSVHQEIFSALGVDQLEPHVTDFGSLIPGLNAGRWDIVTAGMYIIPDRCAQAQFSEPVYSGDSAFLVEEGNPTGLTRYTDLADNPDITIGVMPGTVEVGYAEDAGADDSQIRTYDSQQDGLEAVVAGRIDAFALTSFSLRYLADNNPDAPIEVTEPFIVDEDAIDCGGAVFRQGDTELVEAFNTELANLRESGRLLELISEWGFTETNVPPDGLTTEELCNR